MFQCFDDLADVPYAIISCESAEVPEELLTYQDLLRFQSSPSAAVDGTLSVLQNLPPAVRDACRVASCAVYDYVWLESCCIDETSPAEVSEAFDSMWEWYASAQVCYAYLSDVDPEDIPTTSGSQFRKSKWHWGIRTLPALIASRNVVFLARDWSVLGSKSTLARVLEEVTGVDQAVLKGEQSVHDVSVARRMWWASKRRAARSEDLVHSLLGIFGVKPTSLSLEPNARTFTRLQEEVFRATQDYSIFAWHYHLGHEYPDCLFAPSPCCFARSGDIRSISLSDLTSRLGLPLDALSTGSTSPTLNSAKLSIRLPLIPHQITSFPPTSALYEVFGVAARFSHVAILPCEDAQGRLVVLTLHPASDPGASPAASGNEYLVRAVETTLGQCDRTWSYDPVLYLDAVQVQDVDIWRGPLRSPWVVPQSGPSARGERSPLILDEPCRARLNTQGYEVHYEASRRELVDDLYERGHRARRFVDVHRFTLSPASPPSENDSLDTIVIEAATRRHRLAPMSVDHVVLRQTRLGESLTLDATTVVPNSSRSFKAKYTILPVIDSAVDRVLYLSLSRSPPDPAVHVLRIDLYQATEDPDMQEDVSTRAEDGEIAERDVDVKIGPRSCKNGRVMEVFPRLPSIRGWTSRSR
ncbi:hypothetical protein ONZ51_g3494 [Trametes cubensis]|uniref:Heterokaryon incompatibility domain-containing protein n=1 Tax=Trametes cubensis TaxID=1111947 RepID=A0AAD7TXM0_9APHY|nr:hypothetical protein ONZ51_g3494 [Trametes cubensis]